MFGSDYYSNNGYPYSKYAYKYDTKTNSYTQLTDIPYYFYDSSAVAIGTDIYLFGSGYYQSGLYPYAKYAYKYVSDISKENNHIYYSFNNKFTILISKKLKIPSGKAKLCLNNEL